MATGIILIVLGTMGFLIYRVTAEEVTTTLGLVAFTAPVAGIGLVMLARRITKLEKERERRIARLEEAASREEGK